MKEDENAGADDDLRFVSLCKKGDIDAFEYLVNKHQKKMLNVAYRMVGSYEEACEVVQDAFVSAYKNIKGFEGRSVFSTWLCSIVINLSKNRLKRIKTGLAHERFSIDDPVAAEDGFINIEPASDAPSVLEQLERRELQEKVQGCIGKLDDDFRAVLVLRDIQGFSYDEVGSALRINAGTVKSRLFRAREAVRDCLKKALGRL
jgi:RNA polymerase sigma-70 factor (ECF subfamily)